MFSAPRNLTIMAIGMTALFCVGLTQLLLLRFKAGDVYPAYSSLRSDPLGTQVLFESLNRLAENSARRNYRAPDHITLSPRTTLLVCGLSPEGSFLENKKFHTLMDQVAVSGGRLVLTFSEPVSRRDQDAGEEAIEEDRSPQDGNDTGADERGEGYAEESDREGPGAEAEKEWLGAASLGFAFNRSKSTVLEDAAMHVGPRRDSLPPLIPWRAALSFDLEDDAWQVAYIRQDEPVVVQREWGRGTVVMAADSYLFSNEALRNNRFADLLAWMIAPGRTMIFDEFHHGLVHQPGIAALARQYRLHGVFGALLLVAALLVWRQAAVFVPAPHPGADSEPFAPAAGRDTGEGLVNLARQHIASRDLLPVCYQAWLPFGTQQLPETLVSQVGSMIRQETADTKQRDPAELYRRICELLKQGKPL